LWIFSSKLFKKSLKSFSAHALALSRRWRRSTLVTPIGEYGCGSKFEHGKPKYFGDHKRALSAVFVLTIEVVSQKPIRLTTCMTSLR